MHYVAELYEHLRTVLRLRTESVLLQVRKIKFQSIFIALITSNMKISVVLLVDYAGVSPTASRLRISFRCDRVKTAYENLKNGIPMVQCT